MDNASRLHFDKSGSSKLHVGSKEANMAVYLSGKLDEQLNGDKQADYNTWQLKLASLSAKKAPRTPRTINGKINMFGPKKKFQNLVKQVISLENEVEGANKSILLREDGKEGVELKEEKVETNKLSPPPKDAKELPEEEDAQTNKPSSSKEDIQEVMSLNQKDAEASKPTANQEELKEVLVLEKVNTKDHNLSPRNQDKKQAMDLEKADVEENKSSTSPREAKQVMNSKKVDATANKSPSSPMDVKEVTTFVKDVEANELSSPQVIVEELKASAVDIEHHASFSHHENKKEEMASERADPGANMSFMSEEDVKDTLVSEMLGEDVNKPSSPLGERSTKFSLADIVAKATGIDWAARKAARNARLKAQEKEEELFKTFDDLPSSKVTYEGEKVENEKIESPASDSESTEESEENDEEEVIALDKVNAEDRMSSSPHEDQDHMIALIEEDREASDSSPSQEFLAELKWSEKESAEVNKPCSYLVDKSKKVSLADIVVQATDIDWAARKAARNARLKAKEKEEELFKTFDDLPSTKVIYEEENAENETHENPVSDSESVDESEDEEEEEYAETGMTKEDMPNLKTGKSIDEKKNTLLSPTIKLNKVEEVSKLGKSHNENKNENMKWQTKLASLTAKKPSHLPQMTNSKMNIFGPKKKFQSLVKEVVALEKENADTNKSSSSQEDKSANVSLADIVIQATGIDWAARKAARNARLQAQAEEEELFKTFDDLPSTNEKHEEGKGEKEKHEGSGSVSESTDESEDEGEDENSKDKENAPNFVPSKPVIEKSNSFVTDKKSKMKALDKVETSGKQSKKTGASDILKAALLAEKKKKSEDNSALKQFLYGNIGGQERKLKHIRKENDDETVDESGSISIGESAPNMEDDKPATLSPAQVVAQATGIDWAARRAARTAQLQAQEKEEEVFQLFRDPDSSEESEEENVEDTDDVLTRKEEGEERRIDKFVPPKPEVFNTEGFLKMLRSVQAACLEIKSAMDDIGEGVPVKSDQLKRIANELRIEDDILTKSGKQIIPTPMRMYILNRCHEDNHVGSAKIYEVVKAYFYWPNIFSFIKNCIDKCNECVQGMGTGFIKDVAIPTFDPSMPMEFITLDMVHMPVDSHDNRHLLLIGDVFSKYVRIVPMKERSVESVQSALMENWLSHYPPPQFLLSDPKSKVDGELLNGLCTVLNIQKRCGSGYHGLKKGFAERNIITVKDMFFTLQEEYRLPQEVWSDCVNIIMHIINSLHCSASKELPYKVVAPQNKEVVPQNKEVVPQNKEVAPQNKEVVPQNTEAAPQNKEVVPQNKEVAPQNKEVAPQNKEVVLQNKEAVPQNKEVVLQNKEAVPHNGEIVEENKETISQDNAIEDHDNSFDGWESKNESQDTRDRDKKETITHGTEATEVKVQLLQDQTANDMQDTTANFHKEMTDEQWAQIEQREGCFPSDSKSSSVMSRINASWISASSIEEYVRVLQWQIRELLIKVLNKSWKALMREGTMKQQMQQQQQQHQQLSTNRCATEEKEKRVKKPSPGKKSTGLHFDGTGDVKAFLENAEVQNTGRTDAKKVMFICSKLGGKAYDCFRRLPADEKKSLEAVKSRLLKMFCREERNREEATNALNGCRLPGETNERFAYRLYKLVRLAHAQESAEIQNSIAKYYFKQGIKKVDGIVYDFDDIIENERKKSDSTLPNGLVKGQEVETATQELYSVSLKNEEFLAKLKSEQKQNPMIQSAKDDVRKGVTVKAGYLKRIATELRIENDMLTKSGKPIVPAPLREFILNECHQCNHQGSDKVYEIIKSQFYWQNMYNYIKNEVDKCNECSQKKSKLSLVPSYQPSSPMEFITMDIVFMPKDNNQNRYLLLIGDVFSKYVEIVPIRERTFTSVKTALWVHWLNRHGYPQFLFTGPKCHLEGEILNELCLDFQVDKRTTTGFHSLRRGFAERDIGTVKKMFNTLTEVFKLAPEVWSDCVPCVRYTLNTAQSSATHKCPFIVVYEREPNFPSDTWVQSISKQISNSSSAEYVKEVQLQIKEILLNVLDKSRDDLMKEDVMKQHLKL